MESTKRIQCMTFEDGIPVGFFTLSELTARYGSAAPVTPAPTPEPEAKPVFGHPRNHIGDRDGHDMVVGSSNAGLLEIVGENPDQFVPRGTNIPYSLLPGKQRPSGNDTAWSGFAPPAGFVKPDGYRKRYFGGKADQPYYEQSSLADEVLAGTTTPAPTPNTATPTPNTATPAPTTPTSAGPQPDPDVDWIRANPDTTPGNASENSNNTPINY